MFVFIFLWQYGKLLLVLASTIILVSESRGTHHILLSPAFVSLWKRASIYIYIYI
jgi:hypothetical protein